MGKSASNKAVVVGVSDYRAPIVKLPAVAADVREIAKVLQSKDGAFPKSGTVVLADRQASKAAIESALSAAFGASTSDTVFIYLAGHGAVEADEYYFIPHDANVNDLAGSAVLLNWIKDQFDQCSSERLFLWLDCCHSGGILKKRSLNDETSIVKRTLEVIRGHGRIILAACTAEQSAYENATLGHGVFTHALLRGLKGEAEYHGEVTPTTLFDFIDREIGSDRQRPMMFGHMTGRIVLMHYANRQPAKLSGNKATAKVAAKSKATGKKAKPAQSNGKWIMLGDNFIDASKVRRTENGSFSVDVLSSTAERDAMIQSLQPSQYHRGDRIAFAFENDACDVEVKGITSESVEGGQIWTLTLKPMEMPNHSYLETTIVENNRDYTPRDIAELRARVLLIDERQPVARGISGYSLLHHAVGNNSGSDSLPCVIRDVYAAHKNQAQWKEFARLRAIYLLKMTRTVEHILDLTIGKVNGGKVAVSFRGRRARQYSNAEPETVSVSGACPLST